MTSDFWLWRDSLVVTETDPPLDGLYFDIGFPVIARGCYDHIGGYEHGHPSGAGPWMIRAIRDNLAQPRNTPNPRGFRYGAEGTCEPYVDLVDFWHLGAAGGGPLCDKTRGKPDEPIVFGGLHKWIVEGSGVSVPLMTYLYHHAGNVRTGAKMQISYDIGDVFYWLTVSEYLWGGVVELIYFNTGVDWLPGLDDEPDVCADETPCAFQTSWSGGPASSREWTTGDDVRRADPDKLAFLRKAIELRVASPASPYLTMGRMETAPRLNPQPERVAFSYDYYSSLLGWKHYHSGEWQAAPVIVTAWRHPSDETVAVLVGNASDQAHSVNLEITPERYGFSSLQIRQVDLFGEENPRRLGRSSGGEAEVTLDLPPRSFAMLELAP